MYRDLDDWNRQPTTRRVADLLRTRIDAGTCPAGARLPSYRALMDEHGTLNTAQAAIRLRDGGVTVSKLELRVNALVDRLGGTAT